LEISGGAVMGGGDIGGRKKEKRKFSAIFLSVDI
jgi:hypothetical protein